MVIVNQWVLPAMDFMGMATQPRSFINVYACIFACLYVCVFVCLFASNGLLNG